MAVTVEISTLLAEGLITVSDGTPDQRVGKFGADIHIVPGDLKSA